jgi:hypothetical protein
MLCFDDNKMLTLSVDIEISAQRHIAILAHVGFTIVPPWI